jgi:hypothetical protein
MTCLGRFDRRGAGNCRACTLEQSVVEQEMARPSPKKTNIKLATELLGIDRIRREGCRS